MKATTFPQQTHTLAKDQPKYDPLPVHFDEDLGACIARFELTEEERKDLAEGKPLWLWQYTFGRPFQPVALTTTNPWPYEEAK